MSDSDSDFGDMDFVESACSNIREKWSDQRLSLTDKPVSNRKQHPSDESVSSTKSNDSLPLKSPEATPSPSPAKKAKSSQRGGRKRATRNSRNTAASTPIEIEDSSRPVTSPITKENITPPSSPTGSNTPLTKSGKPRAVRGANRTKKTDQALQKLDQRLAETKFKKAIEENPLLKLWKKDESSIMIEDETLVEVKIRWKTSIHRVETSSNERLGQLMDKFAQTVGFNPGDMGFVDTARNPGEAEVEDFTSTESGSGGSTTSGKSIKWLDRGLTVEDLNLNVASIITARCLDEAKAEENNTIEVKVQTKDRKASVQIKILKTDTMLKLMEAYAKMKQVELSTLKFFFDGEELNKDETGEDLDLEGDEVIDVHAS